MSLLRAARFFTVVPVVSPVMLCGFLAIVIGGCAAIAVDPTFAAKAMTPLLLLQLFACASGFSVPARRGHYDLLLTSGAGRRSIAVAHLAMSAFPGVLAWLALAATERAAGGAALRAPGTLFALAFVSMVAWSVNAPLRRLSGGVLCLLAFFTLAATRGGDAANGVGTLVPWVFVGTHPTGAAALGLMVLLLFTVATVVVSVLWIGAMDVPLESGQ